MLKVKSNVKKTKVYTPFHGLKSELMDLKTVKIQDVARRAGVSTATVSRALSTPGKVAESTREVVLKAVRETGYVVNQSASNLRRQKTNTLVVLLPDLGNPFFSQILKGIEAAAAPAGYNVLIADTKQSSTRHARLSTYLHNTTADGLILMDGQLPHEMLTENSQRHDGPPVVFACEWIDDAQLPSVTVDNVTGGALAIDYLADLGHRTIGHIAGPPSNILTHERRAGIDAAMEARGMTLADKWVFPGDFSIESGALAAQSWLAMAERPTAMFCCCDQMAFGFMSEIANAGLSVPEDVSVIGFDDIESSSHYIPQLTTIRQPRFELGRKASHILIDLISGRLDDTHIPHEKLPVELVVRQSTAAVM